VEPVAVVTGFMALVFPPFKMLPQTLVEAAVLVVTQAMLAEAPEVLEP
jgi:hypothetical protein